MWPDRVSNTGALIYESDALPTALRGPALLEDKIHSVELFTIGLFSEYTKIFCKYC